MDKDSLPLPLFLHNTDSSDDNVFSEIKHSAERSCGVAWEVGDLTIRLRPSKDGEEEKSAAPCFRDIVSDTDICSPQLVADLTRIECDIHQGTPTRATFHHQLYEFTVGAAAILSGLCVLGVALGFCAFLIGVAIPFGLFS
ncbi:hypothetical protein N9L71_05180 [Verrucomicrobiales bacterium]|nr:hypothetical protein [Verrucomicrobiales bacterium]